MISKTDLVKSNLIRYFWADKKVDEINLRLEALKQTMMAHSPNLNAIHGYSGTKDERLLDYSVKKGKLDNELKGWTEERQSYFFICHLNELDEEDIKFLSYLYKDQLKYDEVATKCYYTDKSYVSRKHNTLLDKLSEFI